METPRRTRAEETRDFKSRTAQWEPPSHLPEPAHREGWVHRWCAHAVQGEPHVVNMNKRLQEGWVPVPAEEYPEVTSRIFGHTGKANIDFGGQTLCRMSSEMMASRRAYFEQKNRIELAGVRNDLAAVKTDPKYGRFTENRIEQTATKGRQALDFGTGE